MKQVSLTLDQLISSTIDEEKKMIDACYPPGDIGHPTESPFVDTDADMESDKVAQTRSVASTMMDKYNIEILNDEDSSRVRMESNPNSNDRDEMPTPSAISTSESSASSFRSKNRSSSRSGSDTTGDTTGMKDWGWFEDMYDDHDGSTQMTDGNDKEDNSKNKLKGGFIDEGKATSCGYVIGSDAVSSSYMDEDTKMNDTEDFSITSGRVGEKRKGKKKKKMMLELEFDQLNGPLDEIVNNTKKGMLNVLFTPCDYSHYRLNSFLPFNFNKLCQKMELLWR